MTMYQVVVRDFDGDNFVGTPKTKEDANELAKAYAQHSGRETYIEVSNA